MRFLLCLGQIILKLYSVSFKVQKISSIEILTDNIQLYTKK